MIVFDIHIHSWTDRTVSHRTSSAEPWVKSSSMVSWSSCTLRPAMFAWRSSRPIASFRWTNWCLWVKRFTTLLFELTSLQDSCHCSIVVIVIVGFCQTSNNIKYYSICACFTDCCILFVVLSAFLVSIWLSRMDWTDWLRCVNFLKRLSDQHHRVQDESESRPLTICLTLLWTGCLLVAPICTFRAHSFMCSGSIQEALLQFLCRTLWDILCWSVLVLTWNKTIWVS